MAFARSLNRLLNSTSYERYKLPFVGSSFRGIDQYADYNKMYADYMRNVGRKIKYPSVRDPRANASTSFSSALSGGISTGLKTFRWFV